MTQYRDTDIFLYRSQCIFYGIGRVLLDTKLMPEASRPQWITAESLFIPALYIISHFGKPLPAPGPLAFLSPMFTSILAEMENVGNSLKCLGTKLALLRAKAICDVRVASGITSVFVAWLRAVLRWNTDEMTKGRKEGRKGDSRRVGINFKLGALSRYRTTPTISSVCGKRVTNIRWTAKKIKSRGSFPHSWHFFGACNPCNT